MLDGVWVLSCGWWKGSDVNSVCDQEATVETETEGTDEVSCASRVAVLRTSKEVRRARLRQCSLNSNIKDISKQKSLLAYQVGCQFLWGHANTGI